jgi:dienelactone hydrolase
VAEGGTAVNRRRVAVTVTGLVTLCSSLTPALAGTTRQAGGTNAVSFARAEVVHYARQLPTSMLASGTGVDAGCFSAGDDHVDPEVNASGHPTNPAWIERDALNQYCATLRLHDQLTNPAYGFENLQQGDALWLGQLGDQLAGLPGHIHGGLTTLIPGSQAADSFRTVQAWEQRTGGVVLPVQFPSSDGARLEGNIWLPPPGTPELRDGRHPGVVITDGSIQAYQNLYYWAAEGLAQYGYEVLTYDVQGQGDSDLSPGNCPDLGDPSRCAKGVPYQQNYNFYQGAEDSLSFFESSPSQPYVGSYNPGWSQLDAGDVGIAGHSLGAAAVSWVSQCDSRVKAVVAWDNLSPITTKQCAANVTVPRKDRAARLHAPGLALVNDYEFNPQPATTVPDPNGATTGILSGKTAGFLSLAKAGIDSEVVTVRNGTHLTYSYIPYVLPANEIGERMAFYYTLAWFDEYLRGGHDALLPAGDTAFDRLTSLGRYDMSADHNLNRVDPGAADISFGAGTYSPTAASADPADPTAGNVPYEIQGIPIQDTLSFYYYSEYRLHDLAGRGRPLRACNDMLAGCPKRQPATP